MDVKEKLSQFKSFWSSLPEFVCQDENVAARPEETNCWRGERQGWNISEDTGLVFDEEYVDFTVIISSLKRAYNGFQSHDDDSSDEMSGSGSGSGCMESCVTPPPPLVTEKPNTEWSSATLLHPPSTLLLLPFVLSILTSLDHQK